MEARPLLFSYLHAARDGGRDLGRDPLEHGRVDAHAALPREALAGQLQEDAAEREEKRECQEEEAKKLSRERGRGRTPCLN